MKALMMTAEPCLWLEEVEGEDALKWVTQRNSEKSAELAAVESFTETKGRIKAALDSEEKIPAVSKIGDFYYTFWRDSQHERGLWRRTTLDSYRGVSPEWEIGRASWRESV